MANEQLSLTDILSDEAPKKPDHVETPAPAEAAAEPDAAAQAEAKAAAEEQRRKDYTSKRNQAREKEAIAQGKVRDPDTGQFVAAKDAPAAPAAPAAPEAPKSTEVPKAPIVAPQQEFTEKEKAFLRAAQEERGKRQELERRLAAMEAAKGPAEPVKTFWDDPEAALAKHTAEVRQEATNARLAMAEFSARQRHTDFDEKVAVFAELIQQIPGLHPQWLAAPDPAEFAYSLARNHMELKQAGGIEELRAKIERETASRVRAEVEAELRAKADALAKDRAALPPSLSDARATGGASKPVWGGPSSMDSIINDK